MTTGRIEAFRPSGRKMEGEKVIFVLLLFLTGLIRWCKHIDQFVSDCLVIIICTHRCQGRQKVMEKSRAQLMGKSIFHFKHIVSDHQL